MTAFLLVAFLSLKVETPRAISSQGVLSAYPPRATDDLQKSDRYGPLFRIDLPPFSKKVSVWDSPPGRIARGGLHRLPRLLLVHSIDWSQDGCLLFTMRAVVILDQLLD